MTKRKVWLVQQGVWDMPVESMPLSMGYLKAVCLADERIRAETDVRIFNFKGGDTPVSMVRRLFLDEVPDVVAFSVFGWNFHSFGILAETFRQLNPDGWVIVGGTHVAHQARRVFGTFPAVDVVVDGEGEDTFRELITSYLAGRSRRELHGIQGTSFVDGGGAVVVNPNRPRIQDLDSIPSPFLTGAIPLLDDKGAFRYDVALMETNRGCPYKCSFCYWGGAIGQKVRAFSRDRLKAELELFGYHRVGNVVLCDANFGMLPDDETFVEDLVKTRERFGFPRHLETSWAKNKSKVFFGIVRRMKQTGFRSSFTLALQTLNDAALESMQRKNMKVNDWEDLSQWLTAEGLDSYAEIIWGAPGETCESFLEGYDRLAAKVSRIAVYPLLLMPNTSYSEERQKYGLVTIRSPKDDFEYVLSHKSMTVADNRKMIRFLFWARVVAENMIFRYVWTPLRVLAGIKHSQLLLSLDTWLDGRNDPISVGLKRCRSEMVDNFDASRVESGIRYFYLEKGLDALLAQWWTEEVVPKVPPHLADYFEELFRYDLTTRAIFVSRRKGVEPINLRIEEFEGESYYVRDDLEFRYDVPTIAEQLRTGAATTVAPSPLRPTLYYKVGFSDLVDNHEFVKHFVGKTMTQLLEERRAKASSAEAAGGPPPQQPERPAASVVRGGFGA